MLEQVVDELVSPRLSNFVNEDGSLYIMTQTQPIKRLAADGSLTNFAGVPNPANGPAVDGPLATARFKYPQAMTKGPDGTLYVADDNYIRVIKDGQVTTLAGHNVEPGDPEYGISEDGQGEDANIVQANDIWFEPDGTLFFWDEDKMRSVTMDGVVTTIEDPDFDKYHPNGAVDELGNHYYSTQWHQKVGAPRCVGYVKLNTDNEETCIEGPEADTFAYDFKNKVLYLADDKAVWRESRGALPSQLWKGFARSEVEFFNGVMSVLPPPPNPDVPDPYDPNRANFSFCPVCLGYATRGGGCMYMHHVCPVAKRHPELYAEYASLHGGEIEWCTVCGRICKGHGHILRNLPEDKGTGRVPYPPGVEIQFYGNDCYPYGGGGATEKFVRMEEMVKVACYAAEEVGIRTESEVRRYMIEEIWRGVKSLDDPALYQAATARMAHPIAVPCELPASIAPSAAAAPAGHITRPADEAALTPIEHDSPDNECAIELGPQYEDLPVYQFRHKQPDGTIWNHENEYICAEDLQAYIVGQNTGVFTGLCPFPDHCKARLYPEEIMDFIEASVWEKYEEKFDEHFAADVAMAGGGSSGILYKIDPSELGCLLPPPKKKAGRRTYRKKGKKSRKTRGKKRSLYNK